MNGKQKSASSDLLSTIITIIWETWEDALQQKNSDFNPYLNIIHKFTQYLDQKLTELLEDKVKDHIQQSLNNNEIWLQKYKTIFKEKIDKIEGEIWKTKETRVLKDLYSTIKEEYNNYDSEKEQEMDIP
jgi:hypothetical protein